MTDEELVTRPSRLRDYALAAVLVIWRFSSRRTQSTQACASAPRDPKRGTFHELKVQSQGNRLRRSLDVNAKKVRIWWVLATISGSLGLAQALRNTLPHLGLKALMEDPSELVGNSEQQFDRIALDLVASSDALWCLAVGGLFGVISVLIAAIEPTKKWKHFFFGKLSGVASATLVAFAGAIALTPGLQEYFPWFV